MHWYIEYAISLLRIFATVWVNFAQVFFSWWEWVRLRCQLVWFLLSPISLTDTWLFPPCVSTWSSFCVCPCPSLFLQGHQSYWIRDTHMTSFYLNHLLKALSPNPITFCSTGDLRLQHMNCKVGETQSSPLQETKLNMSLMPGQYCHHNIPWRVLFLFGC